MSREPHDVDRGRLEGLRHARAIVSALRTRTPDTAGINRIKRFAYGEMFDLLLQAEAEEPDPPVTFYAKVERFALECPDCGTLDHVSSYRGKRRLSAYHWDPAVSRWRCQSRTCLKCWVVGLVLWRSSRGPATPPLDQLRTTDETIRAARRRAEEREKLLGIWPAGVKGRRAEQTNLEIEE